jgi:hypothetical protein
VFFVPLYFKLLQRDKPAGSAPSAPGGGEPIPAPAQDALDAGGAAH